MKLHSSLLLALLALALPGCGDATPSAGAAPLVLERTIALPAAHGRIDHLAIDLDHRRLFVAEVTQGMVEEVSLDDGKVVGRIAGLTGPQGVAWLPRQEELAVANDDGTVRFYAADLKEVARIKLGDDADNLRIDPRGGHLVVGFGRGALAIIDPAAHNVVGRVALPGHPEGFQLHGATAYINVPDDGSIFAADIDREKVLARWSAGWHRLNFPMAMSVDGRSFATVFRFPAALARVDAATGKFLHVRSTCGDADDVFARRDQLLVVCGTGHVEVLDPQGGAMTVVTLKGARTGLFVPELDRLFVAAPAGAVAASILEFRPTGDAPG